MDTAVVSVRDAAEALGMTQGAVRQHIASGRLRAVKRGGVWWIDQRELARMARQPRLRGRPLTAQMAWTVILLASGETDLAERLAARDRYVSRAAEWLYAFRPLDAHAARLWRRATTEDFDAHPAELPRIARRTDVLRTGISAGEVIGLIGSDGGEAEVYAASGAKPEIVRDHALDPGGGSVRMRWVDDALWPIVQEAGTADGRAARTAVLLDLLERDDPRAQREAAKALRS